jgi:hypothetical protein
VGQCLNGSMEEADGRGAAGEAGRRCGRPVRPGEGRRREVGDAPDMWAPPVGGCVGEREGGGRWWACGISGPDE